jgi:hypothetical protein
MNSILNILTASGIFCLLLVMALLMESFTRNFNARFINPSNSLWRTALHIAVGFMVILLITLGFSGLITALTITLAS